MENNGIMLFFRHKNSCIIRVFSSGISGIAGQILMCPMYDTAILNNLYFLGTLSLLQTFLVFQNLPSVFQRG